MIRHLYGRLIDTMLATWGLSLAMIGFVTMIFGNTVSGISAPLGSFAIGAYRTGVYELFLIAGRRGPAAGGLAGAALHAARPDRPRHHAEPGMAAALGINPGRSMPSPSPSARRSPAWPAGCWRRSSGVVPTMGAAYIAKAFITVISGGAAILAGTAIAAGAARHHQHASPPSSSPRCWARWRCWSRPSCCCACCRRASPAASSGGRCERRRS